MVSLLIKLNQVSHLKQIQLGRWLRVADKYVHIVGIPTANSSLTDAYNTDSRILQNSCLFWTSTFNMLQALIMMMVVIANHSRTYRHIIVTIIDNFVLILKIFKLLSCM